MNGLVITGTGSYLPSQRLDVWATAGQYDDADRGRIRDTGYRTVCAEDELYPPDMALLAARRALDSAQVDPSEIALLAVTAIHRHGHKRLWSPASWLQAELGCEQALPLTVNQGCNGQLLVLDIASTFLAGRSEGSALVVAADRFGASGFERFTADYGIVYGDGAAAAVITRDRDAAGWRVLAAHSVSDPELEGLHRAAQPAPEKPELLNAEHDVRAAKRRFLAEQGQERLREATRSAVRRIRQDLIPDGDHPRLRRVIYPNLGLALLRENYFPELPGGQDRSLWEFGSSVGHLGSGDQIAGLDYLTGHEESAPGDRVLLLGAGAGFTWTGMLLERS
jgi:3-oxoacyl-[acyl-carrier-protein] synthase III